MLRFSIKTVHLVIAICIIIAIFTVLYSNRAQLFSGSFQLPQLVSPARTFAYTDSRNTEIIDGPSYKKILPKYLRFIDQERDSERKRLAQYEVGRLYYELHDETKAELYLVPASASTDPQLVLRALELLTAIAYHREDWTEILRLNENFVQRFPEYNTSIVKGWRADALISLGRLDEANAIYDELMANTIDDGVKMRLENRRNFYIGKWIGGTSVLEGQVISMMGGYLEGIPVYLTWTAGANVLTPTPEMPITYTDENGRYSFTNLPEGKYNVGIELRQDVLDGNVLVPARPGRLIVLNGSGSHRKYDFTIQPKVRLISPESGKVINAKNSVVKFRWKEVEGAAYYTFILTADYDAEHELTLMKQRLPRPNFEHITKLGKYRYYKPEARIDLTAPGDSVSGFEFYSDGFHPESVLGWAYPGANILWRVQAYNEEERMLADSRNHFDPTEKNSITVTGGKLEPGDQELLNEQYTEAFRIYLTELGKRPDDRKLIEKVNNFICEMRRAFDWDHYRLTEVIKDVRDTVAIPEETIETFRSEFDPALVKVTMENFLHGFFTPIHPLIWSDFVEPIFPELNERELETIRMEVFNNQFDADLEHVKGLSLTRIFCGFLYNYVYNPEFKYNDSPELKEYSRLLLQKSGAWEKNLERFIKYITMQNLSREAPASIN